MVRYMYDSVNPAAIPRDAELVAGYVDGSVSRWPNEAWSWFPNAIKVRISAVGSTHLADVFDVERGAIWPPENVVPLVVEARKAGIDPTVYVNKDNDWGPTKVAFARAGVPEPHWWVARYDGVQEIPPGAIGKQYAHPWDAEGYSGQPWETGEHYDLSVVADYWPGIDNPNGVDEMAPLIEEFRQWYYEVYGDVEPNKNKTGGHVFFEMVNATLVATRALYDVIERLSSDPDVTADQMQEWVAQAFEKVKLQGVITIDTTAGSLPEADANN